MAKICDCPLNLSCPRKYMSVQNILPILIMGREKEQEIVSKWQNFASLNSSVVKQLEKALGRHEIPRSLKSLPWQLQFYA